MTVDAPVVAFLPCRKGSERVPRKNIRPFGSFANGLVDIKLRQLLDCPAIDHVVLSTNDDEIIDFAGTFDTDRLTIHRRIEELSSSATSTDALVGHALDLIGSGHILWTHVTSPFVTSNIYAEAIAAYRAALGEGYDSLMTVTPLHAFLWNEDGPVNYDRTVEKWPRTQTLNPVNEVNSAMFLAPCEIYASHSDRIGSRPLLHPLDRLVAHDIDWNEDFLIAEQLVMQGLMST